MIPTHHAHIGSDIFHVVSQLRMLQERLDAIRSDAALFMADYWDGSPHDHYRGRVAAESRVFKRTKVSDTFVTALIALDNTTKWLSEVADDAQERSYHETHTNEPSVPDEAPAP